MLIWGLGHFQTQLWCGRQLQTKRLHSARTTRRSSNSKRKPRQNLSLQFLKRQLFFHVVLHHFWSLGSRLCFCSACLARLCSRRSLNCGDLTKSMPKNKLVSCKRVFAPALPDSSSDLEKKQAWKVCTFVLTGACCKTPTRSKNPQGLAWLGQLHKSKGEKVLRERPRR